MIRLEFIPDKANDPIVGPQIETVSNIIERYQKRIEEDIVISLGGDGTHIFATNKYPGSKLLFIRPTGTRSTNYLADRTIEDLEKCLERIGSGEYETQEIQRLEVSLNGEVVGSVLQDTWIERDTITIECAITVDDRATEQVLWRDRTKLDVLIVYNAVGASSYSHSVNGPLMEWDTPIIGISQVAPSRALIGKTGYLFPTHIGERQASVELVGWKKETGKLVLDWGKKVPVRYGDVVTIAKASANTRLIRIDPEPLYKKQIRKQEIDFISFRAQNETLEELEGLLKEYRKIDMGR